MNPFSLSITVFLLICVQEIEFHSLSSCWCYESNRKDPWPWLQQTLTPSPLAETVYYRPFASNFLSFEEDAFFLHVEVTFQPCNPPEGQMAPPERVPSGYTYEGLGQLLLLPIYSPPPPSPSVAHQKPQEVRGLSKYIFSYSVSTPHRFQAVWRSFNWPIISLLQRSVCVPSVYVLDLVPCLQAKVLEHQQLQRVINESILEDSRGTKTQLLLSSHGHNICIG